MNATTGLTLLLPSVLKFIGVGASALIGIGALYGITKLSRPLTPYVVASLGVFAGFCGALSFALAVWVDGLNFLQTKGARFDQLCTSASLIINRRIDGARGVVIDQTGIVGTYKMVDGVTSPNLYDLLSSAKIDYVDVLNNKSSGEKVYFRYRKDQTTVPETIENSDAEYEINVATIVGARDISAGIYGQRMTLLEKATGEPLGVFIYFWTREALCPKARQQGLHTTQVAAYILGLRDSTHESIFREAFLP